MSKSIKEELDALSDAAKRLVINYNRNEAPEWEDIEAVHDAALLIRAVIACADAQAAPVAWAQLGMRNGHTYVRMHYEGHLYPPPPDVQRNLNLVPLYAAPPAPAAAQAKP